MKTQNCCFTDLPALEQFIEERCFSNDKNRLIQVFTADIEMNDIKPILQVLLRQLPEAVIIGATTDGEICDGEAKTDSTVISFTEFDKSQVNAQIYELHHSQFKLGQKIAKDMCGPDTKVIILFADGLHTNGDDLLDGIYDQNQEIIIAGGLAGDYRCMKRTLVICQDKIQENAIVACALSGSDLIVNTQSLFGWHPIGKKMLVTKANGNHLYELDGQALCSVYAKYFGESVASALPVSAGEYPLIITRNNKVFARAAINLFPDGSMLYAGNFKMGDKVQFGYGNIPLILSNAKENIEKLGALPIESIFIYSCSARKYFMGNEVDTEISPLQLRSSTAGFFTYGEFFHDGQKKQSKAVFLNECMTLLLLSEDGTAIKPAQIETLIKAKKNAENVHNKLFNLIDATSHELTTANEKLEALVEEKTREIMDKIYTDTDTKLPNRNRLLEDFSATSGFIPVMLAIINIDDFKQVNDYYGYKVGDLLLVNIANQLQKTIESCSQHHGLKLYKLPSDEFAIGANNSVFTKDFIALMTTKIDAIFADAIKLDSDQFFLSHTVGLSLGRAESNDYLENIDGLLLQTNMALREAKDTKVQQVMYHSNILLKKQLEYNIVWTNKIKQAIKEDRFIPYFQAIYVSETGAIGKYECLIRMVETDGSIVTPYMFLDVARKAKLYSALTQIMIHKCFSVFSKSKHKFSINLSMTDIQNATTVAYLIENIKKFDIGNQLILEVLESEAVGDYAVLNDFIKTIKQYGCKIAIDDFGSGYSNFEHIVRMDIDYLKIDGSLIKNMIQDKDVEIMVKMIVEFCREIKIESVAEFVSDKPIYDLAKALGFDYLQGFYLAEPQAKLDE